MTPRVRRATVSLSPEEHVALLEASAQVAGVAAYDWEVGGEVYWSEELFRVLGMEPTDGEIEPEAFFAAIHPDDRVRMEDAHVASMEGRVTPIEYRLVRPDGGVRFVRGTAIPAEARTPGGLRYRGAIVDVTERYEAETRAGMWLRALEESQRIGRIGTFVVVPSTGEIQWSPGLHRLNGLPLDETPSAGRGLECVHPDDRPIQTDWFWQIAKEGTAPPLRVRAVHPDGRTLQLMSFGAKVRLADGIDRVIGTTIDLTERMAIDEQLRSAAKMEAVGTLAAGVAHDFNNYLTVIGASLEVLERDVMFGSAPALMNVRYGLERCASLTSQLLAFARRKPVQSRRVDLRAVVETAAKMLDRALGERVVIALALPSEPVVVEADPAHLEQVVVNLATNARDAMPGGGSFSLRLSIEDGAASEEAAALALTRHATLEVRDDGVGIEAHHLEHVFEPYFTTKPAGSGTGLGLASVYGTVRQHLGSVSVTSERGVGTAFTIRLPLREGAIEAGTVPPPAIVPGGRGRLLVVEDMAELREMLAATLTFAGFVICEADDGAAALALFERERFDLVVSDVVMPGLSGVELADEIERRAPGTPVVLMSGYAGDARITRPHHRVIGKPFSVGELLQVIEQRLEQR